jgi:hypothetical protein
VAIPAQSGGAASKDNTRGPETKQLDNGIGDTLVLDGATTGRRPQGGEGSNSTVPARSSSRSETPHQGSFFWNAPGQFMESRVEFLSLVFKEPELP